MAGNYFFDPRPFYGLNNSNLVPLDEFFNGSRESMPWIDQRMQNYMMQQQSEETSKFLESRRPEAHHHQFVQPREDMMRFVQQRRSSHGVDDGYKGRPEVRQSAGGDKWGSTMHTPANSAHSKSLPTAHQTLAQPLPRSDGHGHGHQYWLDADRSQQEEDYRRSMEVAKRVAMNNNSVHNGRYASAGGQQLGFEQRSVPKQVAVSSQHQHQQQHQQHHQQHQQHHQQQQQHMQMRSTRHYDESCSEDDDDYEEDHEVMCIDGRKVEVTWADKTCNNNNNNRNMDQSGHGHHGHHYSQQNVSTKSGPTNDDAATNESRFAFQHYEAPKSHSQAASFKQIGGQREEVNRSSGAAQGVTKTKQKQQKQPQQQQQQQKQQQQQNGGRKAGDGNNQNSKSNIPAPPQQQGKGHQKKNANAVQASEEINHSSLKAPKVNSKQEKSVHGQQQQQQESTKGVDLLRKVSQDIKQKNGNSRSVLELKVPICCDNCERKVKAALTRVEGVEDVLCDQWSRKVTVVGNVKVENVLKRVQQVKKGSELWQQ